MTTELAILSISQLNRQIRLLLEQDVGEICVIGEVSNLSKPTSGHFYFTLKDATAQLRCVYFRHRHQRFDVQTFQNGQQFIARGQLSLYEARGDYQLIVEQLEAAGCGDLYYQFELLKAKLAALGLFDAQRKKSLPKFPHCIGVITSSSGAALQDILTTLGRRFPGASVVLYPSDVQGKLAAGQLIQAVMQANRDRRCDVIILARGGGSIEDLWAFNDEQLAYTLAASLIPIVTGIGHETDFTIADFVADVRAATPTAAAETVTPDQAELHLFLQTLQKRLSVAMSRFLQRYMLQLQYIQQRMTSPHRLIRTYWQTLDYLERALQRLSLQWLMKRRHHVQVLMMRLEAANPRVLCAQTKLRLDRVSANLYQAMHHQLQQRCQRLKMCMQTLHAVSPLATLDRGYAIATYEGKLLVNSDQVRSKDKINVRLASGAIDCVVE